MSGQMRRMGEKVLLQQLEITAARAQSMSICVVALLEYYGPIPEALDVQIQALLSDPASRKKAGNVLLDEVAQVVRTYKKPKVTLG